MTNRRSNEQRGFVNFPTDKYESTHEGGMFVRLVVYEKKDENWMICSGGHQCFYFDEILFFSTLDEEEYVFNVENCNDTKALEEELKKEKASRDKNVERHFPDLKNKSYDDYNEEYLSRDYLAVMTIGSTGWSNTEFKCEYDDLTDGGKKLYDGLVALYGDKCVIELQTWLDT